MRWQVGFAVADGGEALLGFIRALKAPGAMVVPVEITRHGVLSQQLMLIKKAGSSVQQHAELRSITR